MQFNVMRDKLKKKKLLTIAIEDGGWNSLTACSEISGFNI